MISALIYEGKSKRKGIFQEEYIYCEYTETKLILVFNVMTLDFNEPIPGF
jgi:hypothetical protein